MGRLLRKKDPTKKVKKAKSAGETDQSMVLSATQKKNQPAVKKAYTPVSKTVAPKEKNVIDKSIQFLREVKVELKKVTWPSRKQTLGSTAVVLVVVAIISLFSRRR
jgi:preprotein translocase subunit SecE